MCHLRFFVPWNFLKNLISTIWDSFHGGASPSYDLYFCVTDRQNANTLMYRDATRTVQRSRKVLCDRGSGGRAPSGVQGQRPGGGPRGQSPLEARAFSQSELPRKPPIDTHGRYTYNTCNNKQTKVGTSEKVGIPTKVRKTASLYVGEFLVDKPRHCIMHISSVNINHKFV